MRANSLAILGIATSSFWVDVDSYFNNSCLYKQPLNPPNQGTAPQTFLKDCAKWVIDTTDETWHAPIKSLTDYRRNVLEKYFYWNFTSNGPFGEVAVGIDTLENNIFAVKKAFPDLKIHVTDVFCYGNDIDGYKTVMPDLLVGTNDGGPSMYSMSGEGTGEKVQYSGIAVTYVQRVPMLGDDTTGEIEYGWQYVSEWILHDELSIVRQLNLIDGDDSSAFKFPSSGVDSLDSHCRSLRPTWGFKPILDPKLNVGKMGTTAHGTADDSESNLKDPVHIVLDTMPKAKRVIKEMDDFFISGNNARDWKDYDSWSAQVGPFFTDDMIYDTIFVPERIYQKNEGHEIFNNGTGVRSWFHREHMPYDVSFGNYSSNQMIFIGDDDYATTTTYHKVHWREPFIGLMNPPVGRDGDYWNGNGNMPGFIIRVTDFYIIRGDQIFYNWMWIDTVLLMNQWADYWKVPRAVPAPKLDEYFRPPNSLEGHPAPNSNYVDTTITTKTKILFETLLNDEFAGPTTTSDCQNSNKVFNFDSPDFRFYGPGGVGVATTCDEYQAEIKQKVFFAPFQNSQTKKVSLTRNFNVQVSLCEGYYCAASGELTGDQIGAFLGEPPSRKEMTLRFGMHFRAEEVELSPYQKELRFTEAWMMLDLPRAFSDIGVDLWDRIPEDIDVLNNTRSNWFEEQKHDHAVYQTTVSTETEGILEKKLYKYLASLLVIILLCRLLLQINDSKKKTKELEVEEIKVTYQYMKTENGEAKENTALLS